MQSKTLQYKINDEVSKIHICKKIENKIKNDIATLKSDKKILFIYDQNINKNIINNLFNHIKVDGCEVFKINVKGNKANKSIFKLLKILDFLIKKNFTKKSVIISCGGGVVGDMFGLLSSLYLRGMYYFHIPSTMTSIVDSCIGGKTSVNYKGIINCIGNYYHPKRVYISEEIIKDIPDREYIAGFAEILKCGLIKKNNILKILEKNHLQLKNRNFKILKNLIYLTLKTKINYFANDVYENKGRLNLNFGHTFAHAIEMATEKIFKKEILRHGEAVGLGMICEILLTKINKINNNTIVKKVEKILTLYELPIRLNTPKLKQRNRLQNDIYKFIFFDKKRINKNPRFISLASVGKPLIKEISDYNSLNDVIYKIID